MSTNLSPVGGAAAQFLDNNGNPLSGGKIYTYEAGTTTPEPTYTTGTGAVAHSNPIILDSAGRVPGGQIWVNASQDYKFVLTTSADVTIATYDDLMGINGTGLTTNAATVVYDPAGTGAVATTVQAKLRETVTITDHGAVAGTSQDNTAIVNSLLSQFTHVIVPAGFFRIDGTVEIPAAKTLEFTGGARFYRYSASSANTAPIVWLKGSYANLIGAGSGASFLISQNAAPNGVLLIGHESMATSHDNVNYCTVRQIGVHGKVAQGQTSGDPDVCVMMQNPQLGGKTSYFNTVADLNLANANYGIWLRGWANGNLISNIQGIGMGSNIVNGGALIYDNGSLENTVSDCFLHQSSNAVGLLMRQLNNTSNGGSVHTCQYSSYKGLIFEQGGASAQGLNATDGTVFGCYIEFKANTFGGSPTDVDFGMRNTAISQSNYSLAPAHRRRKLLAPTDNSTVSLRTATKIQFMVGTTQYPIVTIPALTAQRSCFVSIKFTTQTGSTAAIQSTGQVDYAITVNSAGVISANAIYYRTQNSAGWAAPVVSGTNVILGYIVPTLTGTSSNDYMLFCDISVIGTPAITDSTSLVIANTDSKPTTTGLSLLTAPI